GVVSAAKLDSLVKEERAIMLRHILAETPAQKSLEEASIAEIRNKIQTELKTHEKLITTEHERELFDRDLPRIEEFHRIWAQIQPLSRAFTQKEAAALWLSQGSPAAVATSQAVEDGLDLDVRDAFSSAAGVSGAGDAAVFWSVAILVFSIAAGGLLAFFI